MNRPMSASAMFLALLAVCGSAQAGPDWTEIPDAGRLTPQIITLANQPKSIFGVLTGIDADGGPDIADTYSLQVDKPGELVATTAGTSPLELGGLTDFNTTLYLFADDGRGLLANDDISVNNNRSRLLAYSTDGTGIRIPGPGRYRLAVSYNDVFPANSIGAIFDLNPGTTFGRFQVSGPDGPGGQQPIATWQGNVTFRPEPSTYLIRITPELCGTPCQGDANGDLLVDFRDVTAVLGAWNFGCGD